MKKIVYLAIVFVFFFAASTVSAFQHTGTILSVELWQKSGACFVEVDSGTQVYKKKLRVTSGDLTFQKQALAIVLTAASTGKEVTLNIQDGTINGIYLNE